MSRIENWYNDRPLVEGPPEREIKEKNFRAQKGENQEHQRLLIMVSESISGEKMAKSVQ